MRLTVFDAVLLGRHQQKLQPFDHEPICVDPMLALDKLPCFDDPWIGRGCDHVVYCPPPVAVPVRLRHPHRFADRRRATQGAIEAETGSNSLQPIEYTLRLDNRLHHHGVGNVTEATWAVQSQSTR